MKIPLDYRADYAAFKNETCKIVQIHHQHADGTTEMCLQLSDDSDLDSAMEEIKTTHPLPSGSQWLFCYEGDRRFMTCKADSPINKESSC
jgi:hypothetical protein